MIVLQVLRLDVTEEDMEREHRSGISYKGRKLHFSPPGCKNLVKQPFPTQEATFPPFPTQEATEAKESSTGPTGGDEIASGDLVRSGNLQNHRCSKGYFYCMQCANVAIAAIIASTTSYFPEHLPTHCDIFHLKTCMKDC